MCLVDRKVREVITLSLTIHIHFKIRYCFIAILPRSLLVNSCDRIRWLVLFCPSPFVSPLIVASDCLLSLCTYCAICYAVLLFVAGQILVIVEFCRYGNLRSYLLKHKPNFNPSMDYVRTGNSSAVKLGHVSVDMQGTVLASN